MPVAMAPEDTRTISHPRACALESACTIIGIRHDDSPLIDDEPTLTTSRAAFASSALVRAVTRPLRQRSVLTSRDASRPPRHDRQPWRPSARSTAHGAHRSYAARSARGGDLYRAARS